MSGESRGELVQWINETLDLNISKIEECGTGAIYCQLLDSIYLDVPMKRVKFNVHNEYEYISNLKIFQTSLSQHKIDRPLSIEKLAKCRLQDNLEIVQWFRRFWNDNFPNHEYDPVARRAGATMASRAVNTPGSRSSMRPSSAMRSSLRTQVSEPVNKPVRVRPGSATTRPVVKPVATKPAPTSTMGRSTLSRPPPATSASTRFSTASPRKQSVVPSSRPHAPSSAVQSAKESAAVAAAMAQNQELAKQLEEKDQILEEMGAVKAELEENLELALSERNFYLSKLRDIELLIQGISEVLVSQKDGKELDEKTAQALEPASIVEDVTSILYATEEGFELPNAETLEGDVDNLTIQEGEEETF